MDSHQIRYVNFMEQFKRFMQERRAQFPDEPDRGMLKLFAERLDLSPRYLSHVKCERKEMGSNVARKIEAALGLPAGWMDQRHDSTFSAHDGEQLFVEMALELYRTSPEHARRMMLDMMRSRLRPAAEEPVDAIAV